MPSLNFQSQFSSGIRAMLDKDYARKTGIRPKTTTIRSHRSIPIKKGDTLILFKGMRTPNCEYLGEACCMKIECISIDQQSDQVHITVDGYRLSHEKAIKLAQSDGFETVTEMVRSIRMIYGLPFFGDRIHFKNSYDRKYFCNKSVKKRGYQLHLATTQKTINITTSQVEAAKTDRYVQELSRKHNYGVQIINPLFE